MQMWHQLHLLPIATLLWQPLQLQSQPQISLHRHHRPVTLHLRPQALRLLHHHNLMVQAMLMIYLQH